MDKFLALQKSRSVLYCIIQVTDLQGHPHTRANLPTAPRISKAPSHLSSRSVRSTPRDETGPHNKHLHAHTGVHNSVVAHQHGRGENSHTAGAQILKRTRNTPIKKADGDEPRRRDGDPSRSQTCRGGDSVLHSWSGWSEPRCSATSRRRRSKESGPTRSGERVSTSSGPWGGLKPE